MPARKPRFYSDPDEIANDIIARVGKRIVLALPLGLGKACHIANALVKRAVSDETIKLDIFTALTLEKPPLKNELERRFLEPAGDRLFGNYPVLDYAKLLHQKRLPANIQVNEFFLLAGQWLKVEKAQQSYIPANYTHVLPMLLKRGVNVIGQLVASNGTGYSLSGNADITPDILRARREGHADFILAAQVNSSLPFMAGDASLPEEEIDMVLQSPETDFDLFSVPKEPVTLANQAIGLHAARLVQDGGTLQIGIGTIGDAIVKSLILRHTENNTFRQLARDLACIDTHNPYHDGPFTEGVYGVSEMFVEGFLQLAESGILKRKVDNALLHAGFFVGARDFYKRLREMPEEKRSLFQMKPVSFTNSLYGDEDAKRAARVKACFINDAMMVTLSGAVISDALKDQSVVSGVGGQYNFAEQSFALKDSRFAIALPATRQAKGKTVSNIVWTYAHTTIPWHLRDVIITEYGIADLRGLPEAEAIAAMLSIADSRFQSGLLAEAKKARKIDAAYEIPSRFRNNTPGRIAKTLEPLRQAGVLPAFPFGTDFTEVEQRLLPALDLLKQASGSALLALFLKGSLAKSATPAHLSCLERMDLKSPKNIKEYAYQKLLRGALLAAASA